MMDCILTRTVSFVSAMTLFVSLSLATSALAQETTSLRVVGYPPFNASKLPFYLAMKEGIFEKNRLNVSFKNPGSNDNLLKAVKNNEADIFVLSAVHVITNKAAGGPDLVIVGNTGYNYFRFLVEPSITSPEGLKGKKVGTGAPGSTPDRITRLILRKLGLDPEKDVTLVPSGGLKGLLAGEISAVSITAGEIFDFDKSGQDKKVRVLTDYKKLNIYTGGGADYAVSAAFLRNSRDKVKAFLKSLSEAIAVARKDKEKAIEILRKTMEITDPQQLDFLYRIYVGEVIPERPHPRVEAVGLGIEMSSPSLNVKGLKAQDLIDVSLVQELEKEGLFDRLYR